MAKLFEGTAAMEAFEAYVAHQIAQEAFDIAPYETGEYRDRMTVRGNSVGSVAYYAHIIEWGSIDTPVFGVMRRAVQNLGLHLDESAFSKSRPRPEMT